MTQAPVVGERIAGRYDIEEEAGEGGFAKAYKARDSLTGEVVAIKVPNYEGSSNDPAVIDEYFNKESESLAQIEEAGGHPNVMTLIDRGTHDGDDFLVVEYIDGYELDEAIERLGPRKDSEEVRKFGVGLADAMGFLHEAEIVYRDLKPDNVMLTERDGLPTPVLIDFNTATGFDAEGHAADSGTTILGPYKPREVADAGDSDTRQGPWSDVYSIGKILLFLLRGTVPKKDGVNPRDFGVDCEPYLAEIIEKATMSDYSERYPNATVMKDVLATRDPSPPSKAHLTYLDGETQHTVYPGDTLGRRYAKGPTPSIAIEDDQEYISTVQVQFEREGDQWILRDKSTNGTYVQGGNGWEWVLSEAGRKRLQEQGENPADRHGNVPPETYPISDGNLIALVHPSYRKTFQFEEE